MPSTGNGQKIGRIVQAVGVANEGDVLHGVEAKRLSLCEHEVRGKGSEEWGSALILHLLEDRAEWKYRNVDLLHRVPDPARFIESHDRGLSCCRHGLSVGASTN